MNNKHILSALSIATGGNNNRIPLTRIGKRTLRVWKSELPHLINKFFIFFIISIPECSGIKFPEFVGWFRASKPPINPMPMSSKCIVADCLAANPPYIACVLGYAIKSLGLDFGK
ncbi:hypothetical protein [Crenothrix sp.]|uniref:hypothetical protein n=1 Tax=Crenothrix sp. TaxID=3100433 RepID=UPI00374CD465